MIRLLAVGRDKRVNRNERTMQIPEVHSNLIDSRSFTDPTEMSGHSRASTMRQVAWGNAHGLSLSTFPLILEGGGQTFFGEEGNIEQKEYLLIIILCQLNSM